MNCTICQKPIILVPSAEERAKKDKAGRSAEFYRNLFTTHSECELQKRRAGTSELMQRRREATRHVNPNDAWALSQAQLQTATRHLHAVLDTRRTAKQAMNAEREARDWLDSIGSEAP